MQSLIILVGKLIQVLLHILLLVIQIGCFIIKIVIIYTELDKFKIVPIVITIMKITNEISTTITIINT